MPGSFCKKQRKSSTSCANLWPPEVPFSVRRLLQEPLDPLQVTETLLRVEQGQIHRPAFGLEDPAVHCFLHVMAIWLLVLYTSAFKSIIHPKSNCLSNLFHPAAVRWVPKLCGLSLYCIWFLNGPAKPLGLALYSTICLPIFCFPKRNLHSSSSGFLC